MFAMFDMLVLDETVLKGLDEKDAAFVAYLTLYNKQYLTLEDYRFRKRWFTQSVDVIGDRRWTTPNYVLGLNHMSDWSDEEYNNMLGLVPDGDFPEQIVEHGGQN